MSTFEISTAIIAFLSSSTLAGILLTKLLNRKKDSIALKKQSLSLIKEYNEELNKIIVELKNANAEKDELHEKELEEERKLRSKAEEEVVKYQVMLSKSQKQVDDLLVTHKKKDLQITEMQGMLEYKQNMLDKNRIVIDSWANDSAKKDHELKNKDKIISELMKNEGRNE